MPGKAPKGPGRKFDYRTREGKREALRLSLFLLGLEIERHAKSLKCEVQRILNRLENQK
jgi:hypothetical protein